MPRRARDMKRGRSLFRSGQYEAALPFLERAADEHGGFADVHYMLGVIHCHAGRRREAQEHLEKAVRLNHRFAEAAMSLAILYHEQGRYGDARELCRRAMLDRTVDGAVREQLDQIAATRIGETHAEMADAFAAVGDLQRAAEHLCIAVKECPGFLDYRTRLAATLRDLGRNQEALQILTTLADRHPEYIEGRVQLGLCCWLEGDVARAREEWLHVLARQPEHHLARFFVNAATPEHHLAPILLDAASPRDVDWGTGFFG